MIASFIYYKIYVRIQYVILKIPYKVNGGRTVMKRVSLQDIAQALQLSRNTVAKALKDSEVVSKHTKQKVIQKAIEMGYEKLGEDVRLKLEAGIRTKPKKIAVISKREIAEFWNRIIVGISDKLEGTGYSFMLYFVSIEDEKNLLIPKDLLTGEVDGIISLSLFEESFNTRLFETQLPIVFFDAPLGKSVANFKADAVLVDGYNSSYALVKKLIEDGRKKFSFIGDIHYCKTIFDRWMGFKVALDDHDIPLIKELCITDHVPLRYFDYNELMSYLSQLPSVPDAFICANDDIGASVVQFLVQKGYAIPKDMAVTGFDDKLAAKILNPQLTTVHVDNEYVGKRLVESLMLRIENKDMPYENVYITTYPLYRKTT